ncbi:synapse-associated protein 1-like [Mytilus edulis]|uniref:synapse-associated protein 1-like n=1 Tax=Mytilus edulis TaxID=6550 RepID=UPI0039F01249
MGDFAKEQEKFATEKKEQGKRSKTAVPPWVGYNEEETMKKQILALSTDKRNFVRNPPAGVQFQFDFDASFPVAMATSQEDPNLRKMRFELVPKQVKEDVFWRNYFYRVSLIKQPNQLTTLAQEGSSLGSRSDDNQEKEQTPLLDIHLKPKVEEEILSSPSENEFVSDTFQSKKLETDRTIMWSRLPGIPSKMKWPVLVYHDSLHKNMIDVFCKADDAVFTVKMVNLEPFLRSLRSSWEQIGMSIYAFITF